MDVPEPRQVDVAGIAPGFHRSPGGLELKQHAKDLEPLSAFPTHPSPRPTQLQETLRRIPADIHSREATDTRRAADASRALPQVDERQEQLLRLDARKRELDEIRDQQERLAARARSVVLTCQAIEAALAVLDKGA